MCWDVFLCIWAHSCTVFYFILQGSTIFELILVLYFTLFYRVLLYLSSFLYCILLYFIGFYYIWAHSCTVFYFILQGFTNSGSRDNVLCTVTKPRAKQTGVRIPHRPEIYPFSEMPKPILGLAHPASYSMEPGHFFLGAERLGFEGDNSFPSRAEVKNIHVCFHGVYTDGITIVYFSVLYCTLLYFGVPYFVLCK